MRSVSRATWTSALPVSVGVSPNWATSSCLRSAVIRTRRLRLAESPLPSSLAQLARAPHVIVHLFDQRVDGVKAPLTTQPGQKVDAQRLPVEVDIAVEQVRLAQPRPPGPEGGPDADVHGGTGVVRAGHVDTVAGAHQGLVGHDVGGRKTELTP